MSCSVCVKNTYWDHNYRHKKRFICYFFSITISVAVVIVITHKNGNYMHLNVQRNLIMHDIFSKSFLFSTSRSNNLHHAYTIDSNNINYLNI